MLYLNRNRNIAEVRQETFRYSTALEVLYMYGNSIAGVHPETLRNNTALERLEIWETSLGCVPGVPEDVEIDGPAISDCFYEMPCCPIYGAVNTFYDAGMNVCLACPNGTYTSGVGDVNCSDIEHIEIASASSTSLDIMTSGFSHIRMWSFCNAGS